MKPVLSREQARLVDRAASEGSGLPSIILMENAGRGAAERLLARFGRVRYLVVCGVGNNGGDGFVVARHLLTHQARAGVALLCARDDLHGDAAVNARAFAGIGGSLTELPVEPSSDLGILLNGCDVIVDAILGTGATRKVEGRWAQAITDIRDTQLPVAALDLPSGLDADTGEALGVCIRATVTYTFGHLKLGLLTNHGSACAGEIEIVDLGVPTGLVDGVGSSAQLVEASDVSAALSRILPPGHKGEAGHVVIIGGSPGMWGAAQLAALGALRAGAGLVTVASVEPAPGGSPEVMSVRLKLDDVSGSLGPVLSRARAVVLGPGLGRNPDRIPVVEYILAEVPLPVVVDADALVLGASQPSLFSLAVGPRMLTPHPGEAATLLATTAHDVERDRFGCVAKLVELTQSVVVLKGARTLIGSPDALPTVNSTGNAALATAGSGDVLAGIAAALCCGVAPRTAAACAVWLHGRSAELWSASTGAGRGMLAHEIAEWLPKAMAQCRV